MLPALRRLLPLVSAVTALVLAGCSGSEAPKVSPGANGDPKPAESVERLDAPYDRSFAYTKQLNNFRLQTYANAIKTDIDAATAAGVTPQLQEKLQVVHGNVPYTAAYRHAVFLNTINSSAYNPNGASGLPIGAPTATVTSGSTYTQFRTEPSPGLLKGIFPALYTNASIYARVAAVAGSPDILAGCSPNTINEFYIFNGDIPLPSGLNSELRGFNLNSRTDADAKKYKFTPVDNVWYSSRGRITLMRADVRYWAYGSAYDGDCTCPPWPILDQNFIGAVTTLRSTQNVEMFGYWPSNLNVDVCPYGLDTDMVKVAGQANVRISYSGPPIHITIPVREPFSINPTTLEDGVVMSFRKLGGDPSDGVGSQAAPPSYILRNMAFRTRQAGTFSQVAHGDGTPAAIAGPFDYKFVTSVTTSDIGDEMQLGELIMVPTEPLEPNSWYEVGVRLHTASYVLPKDSTPVAPKLYTWRFRTNSKTPY